MKRLKTAQIPAATVALLKRQENKCPLCKSTIGPRTVKRPALDHDHSTGYIRDVLCMNCNGVEGKIFNLARRMGKHMSPKQALLNIAAYWERHETPQHGGCFHPKHKTDEEKRLARNAKARARRKAKDKL